MNQFEWAAQLPRVVIGAIPWESAVNWPPFLMDALMELTSCQLRQENQPTTPWVLSYERLSDFRHVKAVLIDRAACGCG